MEIVALGKGRKRENLILGYKAVKNFIGILQVSGIRQCFLLIFFNVTLENRILRKMFLITFN